MKRVRHNFLKNTESLCGWRILTFLYGILSWKVVPGYGAMLNLPSECMEDAEVTFDNAVGNGTFSCDNGHKYGSKCDWTCENPSYVRSSLSETGYQISCTSVWDSGSDTISNASWHGAREHCIPVACRDVDQLGTGSYTCDADRIPSANGTLVGYGIGTKCSFPCANIPGSSNVFQCDKRESGDEVYDAFGLKGRWTPVERNCFPDPCPSVVVNGNTIKTLVCIDGFDLTAECSQPDCPDNTALEHSNLPVCVVTAAGHTAWEPSIPFCVPYTNKCDIVAADNEKGESLITPTDFGYIGAVKKIQCLADYTLVGSGTGTCVDIGSKAVWRPSIEGYADDEMGHCVASTCEDPRKFPKGIFQSCTGGKTENGVNSLCQFSCPLGFKSEGGTSMYLLCRSHPESVFSFNGQWFIQDDPCSPMSCDEIKEESLPARLQMQCDGTKYGSQCYFSCDSGYKVSDDRHWITCIDVNKYPQWDNNVPTCVAETPSPEPYVNRTPVFTGRKSNKTYLIFNDTLSWLESSSFCEEIFGSLAMPKVVEIHDWLVTKINQVMEDLKFADGAWIGIRQAGTSGGWIFVDGDTVNLPVSLGDMTNGGQLKNYAYNVTYGGKLWLIWRYTDFCTYEECKSNCSVLGATLPNVYSEEINAALEIPIKQLWSDWIDLGYSLTKPYQYGSYYINATASAGNFTEYTQGDGKKLPLYSSWYSSKGVSPPPSASQYADYQNWDQSALEPSDYGLGERCITLNEKAKWADNLCTLKLPLICELARQYPFERWLGSGTATAEPNNRWSIENCGGILIEAGKWNDFECARKLPFVCEVDLHCPQVPAKSFSAQTNFSCEKSSVTNKPQCTFNCSQGFELSDLTASVINCEDSDGDGNGEWVPNFPNCIKIQIFCPQILPSMLHSETKLQCTDTNWYGSTCNISCPETMSPVGGIDRVSCEDPDGDRNGTWSDDIPDCRNITCTSLDDLSPNAEKSCTNSNVVSSNCTLSCATGKYLNNSELTTEVRCLHGAVYGTASWDKNVPDCKNISCPAIDPSSLHANTTVTCTNASLYGSTCQFSCPQTMWLNGENSVTCEDENNDGVGEWNHPIPDCKDVSCPAVETLLNADTQYSCTNGDVKLSTCTLSCLEGKWLNNTLRMDNVTCYDNDNDGNGSWDKVLSNCKNITCPSLTPPLLQYGTEANCDNGNIYNSTCSFSCIRTKTLGVASWVECNDNDNDGIGEWNATIPTCTDVLCSNITGLIPADTLSSCTNGMVMDSVCTLSCEKGKRLNNSQITTNITCTDNDGDGTGTWDKSPPVCEALSCTPLDPSSYSSETNFTCTSGSDWNSNCTFTCTGKTQIPGANSFICTDVEDDKVTEWSPTPQECIFFPAQCDSHLKGHSVECVTEVWIEAGCIVDGAAAPPKLQSYVFDDLKDLSLATLLTSFKKTESDTRTGDTMAQNQCFGFEFPKDCTNYPGTHSTECLNSIWLDKGCVKEGLGYPASLSTSQLNDMKDMNLTIANDAENGVQQQQSDCYGFEFPTNCTAYEGPHSTECLIGIWLSVNCTENGDKYPGNLTQSELNGFSSMNLKDITTAFNNTAASADNYDKTNQSNCYGIVYPDGCDTYYGQHTLDCLTGIWNASTCVAEGTEYPAKLSSSEFNVLASTNLRWVVYREVRI